MVAKDDKRTVRGKPSKDVESLGSAVSVRQTERVLRLRRHLAAVRAEPTATLSGTNLETNLVELLDVVVPSFCDWCVIDLANLHGASRRFAVRHNGCNHASRENEIEPCCIEGLDQRVPDLAAITARVLATGTTEAWPADGSRPACCVVVALKLNDLPFAAISFVVDERHAGYEAYEIGAAEDLIWETATAIERLLLHQDARDAVRHTQRIASQLHQLIASSITVAGLRSEQDILLSLASSTRSVFNADTAIVTLESGPAAPLYGVAQRGKKPLTLDPHDVAVAEFPNTRTESSVPWRENDWLVAPILERRDHARGVIAIRRESGSEFATEDKEVLTLLAQMAATALAGAELSRTIQHSEARWRILVESAPVGIVEVATEGQVRWWNRGAARIFAWPEYDDSVSDDRPKFPEAARLRLAALWADVLAGDFASGRDLGDVEIRGRRRDLTASAALLPSTDEDAPSILTLVDDVTDHRELKSELRHAHQMEIRGQVASSVAHDFNNLLTLISGYAEILATDLGSEERAAQMVKEIQTTASRASVLTEQLQAVGRTKAPEPVVLSPEAAIQSIAEVLERIVGVDVSIHWELGQHFSNVRVDADQFEQMILNLAINARDAMPSGGQLSIGVGPMTIEGDAALDLNVTPGPYVHISVTDTGIGMDEETRQRCFEPLFTTKGPFKGTGLGLAAARRLVEESGGSIQCRSKSGEGTTFAIYLPAVDEQTGEELPVVKEAVARRSGTILLAEDDQGLRRLMVQVLEHSGYLVLEADSGELALELARDFEGPIDLLLSDVVMSLITGDELAQALQATNPELLVLLMSGSADASLLDTLLPGTSDFLAKPFRPSELVDRIRGLLARNDAPNRHP
jgi:signal transduction histidine kinase/ActR/RegA family two-component response regulator